MSVEAGLTIADAARVSGYTLRHYERAGLIDDVGRADSGHRRYNEDDLAWIRVLQCLRATGMPVMAIAATPSSSASVTATRSAWRC